MRQQTPMWPMHATSKGGEGACTYFKIAVIYQYLLEWLGYQTRVVKSSKINAGFYWVLGSKAILCRSKRLGTGRRQLWCFDNGFADPARQTDCLFSHFCTCDWRGWADCKMTIDSLTGASRLYWQFYWEWLTAMSPLTDAYISLGLPGCDRTDRVTRVPRWPLVTRWGCTVVIFLEYFLELQSPRTHCSQEWSYMQVN